MGEGMRLLLFGLLFVGLCNAEGKVWKVLNCAAQGMDLVTTEVALRQGGREVNPVMRQRSVRIGLKAGLCALPWVWRRTPPAAVKATTVVTFGIGAWNTTQIKRKSESK